MTFQEQFTKELRHFLEETFENVHGIYLDKDTSLCQTLAQTTAASASRPLSRRGTSIAAHVEHLTFYLELLERGMRGEELGPVDWEKTWLITQVTSGDWEQMQRRLTQIYQKILVTGGSPDVWERDDAVGNAMAIVTHTAYHLGAIRQILFVVE